MAFRGNQNRNRNFVGGVNNYGGPLGHNRLGGMNMSPWESQGVGGAFENQHMRQGGGPNSQAINFQSINNLLNNLLRNQNPPSLLDLPRNGGLGPGNRNQRGGQLVNRGGITNHHRPNNRRGGGGFQNRGPAGPKPIQKQQGSGGIRKQNAFDRAKKLLAKNSNNKKKDSTNTAPSVNIGNLQSHKTVQMPLESPYDSVPNDMFYCHLCKKHMWDANSFENHIKGRTHLMMREGIEESYRLKANMIRQEAKIAEQFKSIEFDRLKRMGKSKQRQLDYCTMCDLNFHGHISTHRKSDGHLQLKKFLHPKCLECNTEFPTRIDYDTHLLSADHLKNSAEKNVKVGEHKRQTLPISTEEDELRDVRPLPKRRKKSVKKDSNDSGDIIDVKETDAEQAAGECENSKDEDEATAGGDETKEGDEMHDGAEDEEGEFFMPTDPENVILDFADGDDIPSEIDARLPKYNWTRSVGSGLILRLECFECSICGKYLDTEKTVEIHSRTATHHRNFLKFINEKSSDTRIAEKRAAAALEASERKKMKLDEIKDDIESKDDLYDPSEATGDTDSDTANNGGGNEEEIDNQCVKEDNEEEVHEPKTEIEPEPQPEPVTMNSPVKQEVNKTPAKVVPVATSAAPPTSPPNDAVSAAAVAASPNSAPAKILSPARKGFPAQRGGTRGMTGRNRGRGRYNRC